MPRSRPLCRRSGGVCRRRSHPALRLQYRATLLGCAALCCPAEPPRETCTGPARGGDGLGDGLMQGGGGGTVLTGGYDCGRGRGRAGRAEGQHALRRPFRHPARSPNSHTHPFCPPPPCPESSWLHGWEQDENRISSAASKLDQRAPRRAAVERQGQWRMPSFAIVERRVWQVLNPNA